MEENSNLINSIDDIQEVSNIQQEKSKVIKVNSFELMEISNYKKM